jgi:hypothetical protein
MWVGGFLYVDDVCLLSTSADELQRMLHECQTWSEKASKCSLTSHAVELRVSFEMELTESQQTIYREAVANAADVHRDEVSISNLAVLEDGDEMSEPVRRVAGNESLELRVGD